MKKITCRGALFISLVIPFSNGFPQDRWYRGEITDVTENSVTVNGKTYTFDENTIIKDDHDITAPARIMGQKTCCNNIRYLLRDDRKYLEKIIIETDKAVW